MNSMNAACKPIWGLPYAWKPGKCFEKTFDS